MKNRISILVAVLITVFIFGCAAAKKPPIMQDGKQVGVFVLSDRGIKDSMKEDERNDRNEMGQFMEEDLIGTLQNEGYYAMHIQNRNQYVKSPTNYLVIVKINNLRFVGRGARALAGMMVGASVLKNHYEIIRPDDKMALSYDDEDSTIHDWQNSPKELNGRLVKKINEIRSGHLTNK